MSPLTASQLEERLFVARAAVRAANASTLEVIGVVSAFLFLKRAADQPDLFGTPDRKWLAEVATTAGSSEDLRRFLAEVEDCNPRILDGLLTSLPLPKDLRRAQLRELADVLGGLSLSDSNLEFSSTVGDGYDRFLADMADHAGRDGGEISTPDAVAELMVRITAPRDGQSVCDPFAGVGGFLTSALGYVRESEGPTAELHLFGQELDTGTWAIARVNLLLHGVTDGGLRAGDTLAAPAHRSADGSLMRFDRVLIHAPFSMKYDKRWIDRPELTRYGEISDRGMADPLVIQHAISVLAAGGFGALLIPLGVLFRSGAEEYIRHRILDEDRVEAVIGLGSNFLTGTSTPACILVLRSPGGETDWRRYGRVLFINAEGEMTRGRMGNRLSPETIEKIIEVFRDRTEIPGFSRVVPIQEITSNGSNLTVRPYTDQILPEESPADAMALISGRIPKREFNIVSKRFQAFGIEPTDLSAPGNSGHLTFPSVGHKATAAKIKHFAARRENAFAASCDGWWERQKFQFETLAIEGRLLISRPRFIESFQDELRPERLLDKYQLGGVFAAWWSAWHDDLRVMEHYGFQAVLDRWLASGAARARTVRGNSGDRVLDILGTDLVARAQALVVTERQKLVDIYLSWGERYGTSLLQLEAEAQDARRRLDDRLRELGYVDPWGP